MQKEKKIKQKERRDHENGKTAEAKDNLLKREKRQY